MVLDASGESIEIVASGGAGALADDPQDSAYSNLTAQAIIADQFNRRATYLAVDADQSAVLPDTPAATFAPVYDGRSFSDILQDLCDRLGDYTWGVWDHPVHRDAVGMPTWQLQIHARDTTTVGYQAQIADAQGWRIAPAASRAYNGVTLHYHDPADGPGSVTAIDARLNPDLSQGSAPFRFRRFRRDASQRPMTANQAATLAQSYLSAMQNVPQVITLDRASAQRARADHPFALVRADRTIAIPELLPRAAMFPGTPAIQPGANLFYIRQATYSEQHKRSPHLTLLLDQVGEARRSISRACVTRRHCASNRGVRLRRCSRQGWR